jgi:hypothetical protein
MQINGEVDKNIKIILISGDNIYSESFKRQAGIFDGIL